MFSSFFVSIFFLAHFNHLPSFLPSALCYMVKLEQVVSSLALLLPNSLGSYAQACLYNGLHLSRHAHNYQTAWYSPEVKTLSLGYVLNCCLKGQPLGELFLFSIPTMVLTCLFWFSKWGVESSSRTTAHFTRQWIWRQFHKTMKFSLHLKDYPKKQLLNYNT